MSEPASRLPARPSLEQLRKQAKELLQLFRAGDPGAAQRFRSAIPRFATADPPADAPLAEAQFVVAREYGFRSWAELVQHVEQLDPAASNGTKPPIRPVELATTKSIRLKDGDVVPADTVWNMFLATRAGDFERVKALVDRHPGLALHEYNYTPPIHFAVREGHADLVRLFLALGADATYTTYPVADTLVTMADDRGHHEVAQMLRANLARRFALADGTAAILKAAKDNDLARVNAELTREPALARSSNETGETALHLACENGNLAMVTTLIAAGADVESIRGDGRKPIHCAIMRGFPARASRDDAWVIADTLIANGARYNILIAALRGDMTYVRDALNRDASLANFEDSCHYRPISVAAERNDVEMVKLLLAHGADPNLPEHGAPRGHALWHAVYRQYREIARLLVEHGADPNAMVESSGTPMGHARNDPALLQLLLAHGGVEQTRDEDRLERLMDEGNLTEVERMLQKRPDLAHNDSAFWSEGVLCGPAKDQNRPLATLLMRYGARVPKVTKWAPFYYFEHYDMAQWLLEHGMDPNHMNWHRFSLLHHFSASGDVWKTRLLLDHGAEIDPIDEEYRSTPLGVAARWGRRDVVALLLERGADPNASGAPWATPLAWARKKGHADIEAALVQAGATA